MDADTQTRVTDPYLEEFAASREEADMKPKIIPIHVFNDVTATMAKVTREVCVKQICCIIHLTDLPPAGLVICAYRFRNNHIWLTVECRSLYRTTCPRNESKNTQVL
jgi:hypothetical protein